MKVVINKCFGGFGLSPRAVKRLAELNGKECYFFRHSYKHLGETDDYDVLVSLTLTQAEEWGSFVDAYDIPNPNEVLRQPAAKEWPAMTKEEKETHNALYSKHSLYYDNEDRANPKLIQVIEELGSELASGTYSKLELVEIPDGIEYEIDEYDGQEHIAEKHRTWG